MANSDQPYTGMGLREQLFMEARAMAEYALANGFKVPISVIQTLELFEVKSTEVLVEPDVNLQLPVDDLVRAHSALVRLVEPAKPSTILLLDCEQKSSSRLKFLGPVSLIRQMMVAAIISMVMFITLALSHYVKEDGGHILSSGGIPLLLNLLFFLSAAGLGASFSALYKANTYIANGTFDPTYHSSYWIRFFLGLIAGLMLSVLISKDAFKGGAGVVILFEPGIIHPMLAMLGGFSADLLHTILSRLVEAIESLFRGSTKSVIAYQLQEEKSRLASAQVQQQSKLAIELLQLQQTMGGAENSDALKSNINKMLNDLLPDAGFSPDDKPKEPLNKD